MVHNSRQHVSEKIFERIYRLFFEVLSKSKSPDAFVELMDDILTPAEKIMIAKRIGICYLLIKEADHKAISEILSVSTSTVSIYSMLHYKKDSKLVSVIKTMLEKEKILAFMDDLFADIFIQPGIQKGHWKMHWDHEKRKEKRKYLG